MKSGDLARQFGVSAATIRLWTKAYEDYLTPSKTKHRIYSDEDVLVLATVATLAHQGHNHATIREKLEEGERVEHPGMANFGVDTRMVPAAALEQIVDATEIKTQLIQAMAERDSLADKVEKLEAKLDNIQSTHKEEIRTMSEENAELRYKLGRAEMQAEMLREQLNQINKPNDD